MSAGTRNLHAPLGAFLPDDIGKIHKGAKGEGGLFQCPAVAFGVPDEEVRRVIALLQNQQHVFQRPNAEHLRLREIGRLQGTLFREDAPLESLLQGQFHHGQGAAYGPKASV